MNSRVYFLRGKNKLLASYSFPLLLFQTAILSHTLKAPNLSVIFVSSFRLSGSLNQLLTQTTRLLFASPSKKGGIVKAELESTGLVAHLAFGGSGDFG